LLQCGQACAAAAGESELGISPAGDSIAAAWQHVNVWSRPLVIMLLLLAAGMVQHSVADRALLLLF
jgi:hypothetical protein